MQNIFFQIVVKLDIALNIYSSHMFKNEMRAASVIGKFRIRVSFTRYDPLLKGRMQVCLAGGELCIGLYVLYIMLLKQMEFICYSYFNVDIFISVNGM